jgi:hypothetical protein
MYELDRQPPNHIGDSSRIFDQGSVLVSVNVWILAFARMGMYLVGWVQSETKPTVITPTHTDESPKAAAKA